MLTLTSKSLQRDRLVNRRAYPTTPPKVAYELTERGHSLIEPVSALSDWAVEHRDAIEASRLPHDLGDRD